MITSTSNPQIKQLQALQKKSKEREQQDVFLVEGIKMYHEAPKDRLVRTYVSESFLRKNPSVFAGVEELTELSDRVFESVSDTKTPQGVLCLVRRSHHAPEELLGASPLLLLLENIQDPGNLGTILRDDGLGLSRAVLLRAGLAGRVGEIETKGRAAVRGASGRRGILRRAFLPGAVRLPDRQ